MSIVASARRERLDLLKAKIRKRFSVQESTEPRTRGGARTYVLVVPEFNGWSLRITAKDEGLAWARLSEKIAKQDAKDEKEGP